MYSVEHRLERLALVVHRRQMEQAQPVDDLSRALEGFADELASLDSIGKAGLLGELNRDGDALDGTMGLGLTMDELSRFISDLQGR